MARRNTGGTAGTGGVSGIDARLEALEAAVRELTATALLLTESVDGLARLTAPSHGGEQYLRDLGANPTEPPGANAK